VLYLRLIILSVRSDVPVDSEMLLVTDFMNLKIKSVQSFGYAHKGMVYVHVFIKMSTHTCIRICICTVFLKNPAKIRDRDRQSHNVSGHNRFDITLKKCPTISSTIKTLFVSLHLLFYHINPLLSSNAFMNVKLLMCDCYLSNVQQITRS
jgi:hypothetical protein